MKRTLVRLAGTTVLACLGLAALPLDQSVRIAIAIAVGLPAFLLMIISRRNLGKSFAVTPKAKELVTTGLYARIQHPMYVFLDFFLFSIVVAIGVPALMLAWGGLVLLQVTQARREEKVLSAAFGDEYNAYEERTWI
jgi:protein-S-isoprenylcysteine O-methyltransferase Ste14